MRSFSRAGKIHRLQFFVTRFWDCSLAGGDVDTEYQVWIQDLGRNFVGDLGNGTSPVGYRVSETKAKQYFVKINITDGGYIQ